MIATASPRSAHSVDAAGADRVIDCTATTIADALDAPVDLVINLVAVTGEDTAGPLDVIVPGGTLVSATTPDGDLPERSQRVVFFSVRSDTAQPAQIVDLVDLGRLQLDIEVRRSLSDIAQMHQLSEDGALHGRTLLIPRQSRRQRIGTAGNVIPQNVATRWASPSRSEERWETTPPLPAPHPHVVPMTAVSNVPLAQSFSRVLESDWSLARPCLSTSLPPTPAYRTSPQAGGATRRCSRGKGLPRVQLTR